MWNFGPLLLGFVFFKKNYKTNFKRMFLLIPLGRIKVWFFILPSSETKIWRCYEFMNIIVTSIEACVLLWITCLFFWWKHLMQEKTYLNFWSGEMEAWTWNWPWLIESRQHGRRESSLKQVTNTYHTYLGRSLGNKTQWRN